jgi:hypothetical protein
MNKCDIAIIGAGPYGLSAAAHLRSIPGLDVKVFGEPMSFWAEQMPQGMLLRSPYVASHLADPHEEFTLDSFQQASGVRISGSVPLDSFVEYGRWFQKQAAPDLERREVSCIGKKGDGFALITKDEMELKAQRIVVAGGIAPFPRYPHLFRGMPKPYIVHSSELRKPSEYAGRKVLVIGGGQSALESAALLHEAGAEAEVIVRAPVVHWLGQRPWLRVGPLEKILYGKGDIGPAGVSQLVQRPNLFRLLPRKIQDKLGPRAIRAAGAKFLISRMKNVSISTNRFAKRAALRGDKLHISLNDGAERVVDHVLLGTGYKVDISLYPFLSRELLGAVDQFDGFPKLQHGLESSVPGLHFLGAPAAWSFGPLMRFVAGTEFASSHLAQSVRRKTRR